MVECRAKLRVVRGRDAGSIWLSPGRQDPATDQSPGRPDQRLTGGDFVLAQVASDDAYGRIQVAGEEDRVLGIASGGRR